MATQNKTLEFKTFNQWSNLGYKIKKGSKAYWIDDIPMFSKEQVSKLDVRASWSIYEDEEEDHELWQCLEPNQ